LGDQLQLGVPVVADRAEDEPPFTPGPGCSRLREGDRVGALAVWGADAERVCVPEKYADEMPRTSTRRRS
jgi:hypothetical protein